MTDQLAVKFSMPKPTPSPRLALVSYPERGSLAISSGHRFSTTARMSSVI
jgi:hypothetical protein